MGVGPKLGNTVLEQPQRNNIRIILSMENFASTITVFISHVESTNDFTSMVQFCHWYLSQCEEDNEFPCIILISDVASRQDIFNHRFSHIWADKNPHSTIIRTFQV